MEGMSATLTEPRPVDTSIMIWYSLPNEKLFTIFFYFYYTSPGYFLKVTPETELKLNTPVSIDCWHGANRLETVFPIKPFSCLLRTCNILKLFVTFPAQHNICYICLEVKNRGEKTSRLLWRKGVKITGVKAPRAF